MDELASGVKLTGQLERDLLDGKPDTEQDLQEAGRTLASHVRKLITDQRPLGQARLAIHLPAGGDTALASLGTSLAQVIAHTLSKRVTLNFGDKVGSITICPESQA